MSDIWVYWTGGEGNQISSVLIITDEQISSLGLMNPLLEGQQQEKIDYIIYDKTVSNLMIAKIEEALVLQDQGIIWREFIGTYSHHY